MKRKCAAFPRPGNVAACMPLVRVSGFTTALTALPAPNTA
jgi:hypothetical protein